MQTPRALFILGMHRSGTSALSGAIASAGVYFGDDLLEAEAGVNDKGFWEHRELVRLNEALLAHAELKWFTPVAADAMSAICKAPELAGPLFDQARSFARKLLSGRSLVAIKDPRLCLLAPFWQKVFALEGADCCAIHLLRHPAEVQASLLRRDGIKPDHANALWLEHAACAQLFCTTLPAAMSTVGSYDQLMRSPDTTTEHFLKACGLDVSPEPTQIKEWIQSDLRHHKAGSQQLAGVLGERTEALFNAIMGSNAPELYQPDRWSPCEETISLLRQLAEQYEDYNRTVRELQSSRAQLDQLGETHEQALAILANRDTQIAELWQQHEALGQLHTHAQNVVEQRDQALEELVQRCSSLDAEVAQLNLVRQQLRQRLEELESHLPVRIYKKLFLRKKS